MHFIVLNGPPGSGKTTIARELTHALGEKVRVYQDSFAAPMKHLIATALGEKYVELDKERMRPELNGRSVRQFLIGLSEQFIKTEYGADTFGRWLLHRALRYAPKPHFVICDDGGFQEELDALDKVILVRIERPGCDFSNDSRSYIPEPHWTLINDVVLDELWIRVRTLAYALLSEYPPAA